MPSLGEILLVSGVAVAVGRGVVVGIDVSVAIAGMDVVVGGTLTSGVGVDVG